MQLDINGHETTIKTREVMEFRIHSDGALGKIYKVEKPYVLWIKTDPWNSEMHQFATQKEAAEFLGSLNLE
jgi:hypothetical protein